MKMNFRIRLEDRIARVREKLEQGNFKFSKDDLNTFSDSQELRSLFLQKLKEQLPNWTPTLKKAYIDLISSAEDFSLIDVDVIRTLSHYDIETGDLSEIESYMPFLGDVDDVVNHLQEKLKDPSYHAISGAMGDNVILSCIEQGRIDLVRMTRSIQLSHLSQKAIEKIAKEYNEPIPPYAFTDIDAILAIRQSNDDYLTFQEYMEKYPDDLEKLKEEYYSPKRSILGTNLMNFQTLYETIPEAEKEKFLIRTLEGGLYPFFLECAPKELILREQDTIIRKIKEGVINVSNMIENDSLLLENPEYVKLLIQAGNIYHAMESPIISNFLEEIKSYGDMLGYPLYIDIVRNTKIRKNIFSNEEFLKQLLLANLVEASPGYFYPEYNQSSETKEMIAAQRKIFELDMELGTCTRNSLTGVNQEEVLKEIISRKRYDYFLENGSNFTNIEKISLTEEECQEFLDCLGNNVISYESIFSRMPLLVLKTPTLFHGFLTAYPDILEKMMDYIKHHEELSSYYTEELYQTVKGYYIEKSDLREDSLDSIMHALGPQILRYIENENIIALAQQKKEMVEQLLQLFKPENYTLQDAEIIYDSLKQYSYGKKYPEIVNIFSDIKHSLEDNDGKYIQKLEELVSSMDEKFYRRMQKSYPDYLEICKKNPASFLKELAFKAKEGKAEESQLAYDILHFISDYYVATKREQYRDTYQMSRDLSLIQKYDPKDLETKFMKHCMEYYPFRVDLIEKLKEAGISEDLAIDLLQVYLKKPILRGHDIKELQKQMKFFVPFAKKYFQSCYSEEYQRSHAFQVSQTQGRIKFYDTLPPCEIDRYQVLVSLHLGNILDTLLGEENEKYFELLKSTIAKYKLLDMPACYQKFMDKEGIGISQNVNNIAGFISYFKQIYDAERKRLNATNKEDTPVSFTITRILKEGEAYGGFSKVYGHILGTENARLIMSNPGPNAAAIGLSDNGRLKTAVEDTKISFQKESVTIPSFAGDIELSSGKTMYVSVGNATHPSNLTHGERTGACMRIGGAGETLFNFCLQNENGFHIRFEDSKTGEYISRVSGFRNGNTIFLNELRNSVNGEKYSDEEVIDACRKVAESLIERSKGSSCPIENVVVYSAYATQNMPMTSLGITNNKLGLPTFYSDITNSGIILATTEEPFAPVKLNQPNLPHYPLARERAKEGNFEEMSDMIYRVHSVKRILEGQNYMFIEPPTFQDEIEYAIASQDWYIAIDKEGTIYEELIPGDERALEELETARKIIQERKMTPVDEESYQI